MHLLWNGHRQQFTRGSEGAKEQEELNERIVAGKKSDEDKWIWHRFMHCIYVVTNGVEAKVEGFSVRFFFLLFFFLRSIGEQLKK